MLLLKITGLKSIEAEQGFRSRVAYINSTKPLLGGLKMAKALERFSIADSFGVNLPAVSLEMLLDFLLEYEILTKPHASQRKFRWFSTLSKEDVTPSALSDNQIVYICRFDAAKQLLESHPAAFAIILTNELTVPDWVAAARDRVVLVHQKDTFSYFIFLVQQYFVQLLIWENEIDRVIYQKGSLNDLLNAASSLIINFISITDSKLNLLAYTQRIKPPDKTQQHLVDVGCLPYEVADNSRKLAQNKSSVALDESEESPYKRLHYPLYINHTYFGSVVMVCNEQPLTKGLRDLFDILLKRVVVVCESYWKRRIQAETPHYFFFAKLLNGEHVSAEYIENQLQLTSIPLSPQLKLLVLEPNETDRINRIDSILGAASKINHNGCYCFVYKKDVLVLCYEVEGDSQLSHKKSADELDQFVYQPFGINSGVSQIFESISDIDMAYKQAKTTLSLKNTIQSELFATGEKRDKGVYLFEDALIYYLVSQTDKDERFLSFSFSHTVLQKIYNEDQKYGTNNVALFWFYLHHERNATIVAQRLHLHRNTVLYHIEKIQKRFDFDLSIQSAREKMLIDFKVFFLLTNHESIEEIFAESKESARENLLPSDTIVSMS